LGPESYAIIEQGRITQILSNKPMERRAVIEEAAGVSKFKTRRRLAEAKLEGAKQNLSRVFDILEEVGRQVNSLKRQASKAKRYEELKVEMLGHLRRALAGRYQWREREAAKAALDLNEANHRFQELSAGVAELEKQQASLQEQCFSLEHELTQKRRELSEFRLEAERSKGKLESQSGQVAAIEKRLAQDETETREMETRAAALRTELESHTQRLNELDGRFEEARLKLAAKNTERDQRQSELQRREQALESGRQQVLRLLGETSTLKNQLAQVGEYLSGLDRENTRAAREEETVTADMARLTGVKNELSTKIAARQMELTSVADQRRGVEQELQARRTSAAETRKTLEGQRSDLSRLRARRDSTQEILSHRSYTADAVKRLFTAIQHGKAADIKPIGVLADFMEVVPAWEKAAEEFLHEELEYVVVRDWQQASEGIDLMSAGIDGRATFLVHPEPDASIPGVVPQEPAIGPETGIVARLSAQLKMTNGLTKAPSELIPRLARCFLVDDRTVAQGLSLRYPDLYFLMPDGVSFHGHAVSGGKKTGAGPLALKRELRELTALHEEKALQVEKTAAASAALEQEIAALGENLERLRGLQQAQEKDALALEHEMRKLSEDSNRANQRLSVVRLELQRLAADGQKSREKEAAMRLRMEETEKSRGAQEEGLETARREFAELQQQHARLSEEHAQLRADLAALEERRRAELLARGKLETQIAELVNRLRDVTAEMERIGADRARLLADNLEITSLLAEYAAEIGKLEESVKQLEALEQEARTSLAQAEEGLRGMRVEASAAQENRAQVEVQLVKLRSEMQYLEETCRKEMNLGIGEIAAEGESVLNEDELVEVEAKYQEVRTRIDNLGPVNPQALEEFQEAQQRYDFLNTQRQDLLDSIRDTEKAIQEIDVESRKRFNEAFEAINENFKRLFTVLFNGGSGEMRLNDPEGSADAGVDIMASPPGKRLQNVLLLSGGERSMTAMALLMAIFQYTPSPFCVLDEVDAALDEANTARLVRLLKEMSDTTQFIIVTHAKHTMEASESMYGVTMQEPGVSKVVSVRFGDTMAPSPAPRRQYAMAVGAD
ncbi:MAG: chromosome segregation protein SMC, partial [Candidatus Solibacter usitatus]|nr:chromosome segregation protein SMC [Candidatus Solibacter usitatus]